MPATVSATASSGGPAATLDRQNASIRARSPVAQRPAPGPLGETEKARLGAGLLLHGRRLAPGRTGEEGGGQQGEGAEVHRSEVELLDLVGGRMLTFGDALESVRAGLGRERPGPRIGRRRR